jgi:hypothetical protein
MDVVQEIQEDDLTEERQVVSPTHATMNIAD